MTPEEKLAGVLAAVQTDPGNRGLARDPDDNLFTATRGDFQAACKSIANRPTFHIQTGFLIPTSTPPAFETDGPLGAAFLLRAIYALTGKNHSHLSAEKPIVRAIESGISDILDLNTTNAHWIYNDHILWIERAGPTQDGNCYSMRGHKITNESVTNNEMLYTADQQRRWEVRSIGIGDGGNEIGMGKIPHETIVKNIPNGDLIHCRVPTDHLIVAGVSNWGAYALAAGIFVLKGITPPDDLFDPDREREILEVMVKAGPLVDGVTGEQTATVDGLTWEEYVKPLVRIRDILAS